MVGWNILGYILMFINLCVYVHTHTHALPCHSMDVAVRGQLTGISVLLPPMWILELGLRWSGLAAEVFTC